MSLFYKWLTVLLCTTALNFFIVLKTTNASAQVEVDQTSCPITLLWAVLKGDTDMAEFLLEHGADPNASFESCQLVVTNDTVMVLFKEDQKFVDAWSISARDAVILSNMPDNSSLLHIAAQLFPVTSYYTYNPSQMYNLLVSKGAKTNADDAAGRTPESILIKQWMNNWHNRYSSL